MCAGSYYKSASAFFQNIENKIAKGNQCLFALKTLKSKGLSGKSLNEVCRATFFNSLTYASQAWWGFANVEDRGRLQSLVNKAIRWELDGQFSLSNLDNL